MNLCVRNYYAYDTTGDSASVYFESSDDEEINLHCVSVMESFRTGGFKSQTRGSTSLENPL